jgi:hypothetical protein
MLGFLPPVAAAVCACFYLFATDEPGRRKLLCASLLLLALGLHFVLPAALPLGTEPAIGAWMAAHFTYLVVAVWVITYYRMYS